MGTIEVMSVTVVATLYGPGCDPIPMTMDFNDVFTGSGWLTFRSPHLLLYFKPAQPPKLFQKITLFEHSSILCLSLATGVQSKTARFQEENKRLIPHGRNSLFQWPTSRAREKCEILKPIMTQWDTTTDLKLYILTLERTLE